MECRIIKNAEDVVSFEEGLERMKTFNQPGITAAIQSAQESIELEEQLLTSQVRKLQQSTPTKKHRNQSSEKRSPSPNATRRSEIKEEELDEIVESQQLQQQFTSPRRSKNRSQCTPSRSNKRMITRSQSPCRSSAKRSSAVVVERSPSRIYDNSSQKKQKITTSPSRSERYEARVISRASASQSPSRKSPRNHSPSTTAQQFSKKKQSKIVSKAESIHQRQQVTSQSAQSKKQKHASSPSQSRMRKSRCSSSVSPQRVTRRRMSASPPSFYPTNNVNQFVESPEFGSQKRNGSTEKEQSQRQFQLETNPFNQPQNHNNSNAFINAGAYQNNNNNNNNNYMCFPKIPILSNGQPFPNSAAAEILSGAVLLSSLLSQVKPAEMALSSLFEHLKNQKNASSSSNNNNNNNANNTNANNNNSNENQEQIANQASMVENTRTQSSGSSAFSPPQQLLSCSSSVSGNDNEAPLLSSVPQENNGNVSSSFKEGLDDQSQFMQQQRHSVVIPSPKRQVAQNLSISSNSSFLRTGSAVSMCPIYSTLKVKILPMLEQKIRAIRLHKLTSSSSSIIYDNDKDMWLCEIVDCVRHLKTLPIDQIYQGEYSMLLEQVHDALLTIADSTKRNFQYVLSMITRTMSEIDRKIIKHLHDYSRIRGEKYTQTREIAQTRMYAMLNAIKIEDEPADQQATLAAAAAHSKECSSPTKNLMNSTLAKVKVMFESGIKDTSKNVYESAEKQLGASLAVAAPATTIPDKIQRNDDLLAFAIAAAAAIEQSVEQPSITSLFGSTPLQDNIVPQIEE